MTTGMNWEHLIQAPRLWPAGGNHHRRASWMELFFDLIFVAAIAEAGAPLSTDYSWTGVFRYAFLFVLIWWAWSGHTFFCTRFDTDDLVQRCLVLLQCFIVAVMAANARDALDSVSSAGFGAAYAAMRLVLAVQYWRASRIAETRELTRQYALGISAAALIWIASALVEVPFRYWLWAAALALDFATPWLASRHALRFPPDATHLPERFGLFTIILLGEVVVSVMHGIESQEHWSVSAASTALLSMAFAFSVWWSYFDANRCASERHIHNRRQARLFHVWEHAHLPLFIGIGVAGVGLRRAISLEVGKTCEPTEAWVLSSAAAALVLALTTLGATSDTRTQRNRRGGYWSSYLGALVVAALGAIGPHVHRVVFVASLVVAVLVQGLLARREAQTFGCAIEKLQDLPTPAPAQDLA